MGEGRGHGHACMRAARAWTFGSAEHSSKAEELMSGRVTRTVWIGSLGGARAAVGAKGTWTGVSVSEWCIALQASLV